MAYQGGVLFRVAPYVIDPLSCFLSPLARDCFQPCGLRTRQSVDKALDLPLPPDGQPFMRRHGLKGEKYLTVQGDCNFTSLFFVDILPAPPEKLLDMNDNEAGEESFQPFFGRHLF